MDAMFLSANELRLVWGVKPTTVVHVGAHVAEERSVYSQLKVNKTLWIEAQPELASKLVRDFEGDPAQDVVCAAVWSSNGASMNFNITSNSESSSLLDLKLHSKLYPEIRQVDSFWTKTATLDYIVFEKYNADFLNLDIQGAELEALKGAGMILTNVKWIYVEVNENELYEGCPLAYEIEDYLKTKGFTNVATRMWLNHGWGDSLYIRNELVSKRSLFQSAWKVFFDMKWEIMRRLRLVALVVLRKGTMT